MGVIIRQSIKTSLVTVVGLLVGVFNMLLIYTLDFKTYGFLQVMLSTAMMISPIASLGIRGVINRYFPDFKENEESRAVFFTFGVLVNFIGIIVLGLFGYFVLLPILPQWQSSTNNVELFVNYAQIIFGLTAGQMLLEFLDSYVQNFKLITVQTIFTNLVPKFFTGALVYGAYHWGWDYMTVGYGIVVMNFIVAACLLAYLAWLGELRWSFNFRPYFTPELRRSMFSYASYAIIGIIGSKIALQIDTISLGSIVSEEAAGVYRIIVFASTVIDIPMRSMSRITVPIIAEAMNKKDYLHVERLYKDSSRTLTFAGLIVFTCLMVSLQDIFQITGKAAAFSGGLATFAFLGGSKILHMLTSINNHIVMYSYLYRYNLFFVISLAFMNVYFNYLMIGEWQMGIVGAALATFLALSIYNLVRSLLIYFKLGIHPLTTALIWPALLSAAFIWLFMYWKLDFHPVINIGIRGSIICLAYLALCWYTPFFPAIRNLLNNGLQQIRNYF